VLNHLTMRFSAFVSETALMSCCVESSNYEIQCFCVKYLGFILLAYFPYFKKRLMSHLAVCVSVRVSLLSNLNILKNI
jgi:hypothetical protein